MIRNIAALTAILSATQVAAQGHKVVTASDGAELKKIKSVINDEMAGPKAVMEDKIKSYVKLARDEFHVNNKQHTVQARQLAGAGTGYFYQTHYTGAGCRSPQQQTGLDTQHYLIAAINIQCVGVRLGRCHTDSTNIDSYRMECTTNGDTGTLNLYYYDSADCTGGSTVINTDSEVLKCDNQDRDDDGPIKAIAYGCTTGSAPWKELGDAVIFE